MRSNSWLREHTREPLGVPQHKAWWSFQEKLQSSVV
jgi:hypothetical protein